MLQEILSKLRKSVWLTPTLFSFVGFALAVYVILLDVKTFGNVHDTLPTYLFLDSELAKTVLSTISVALLTMMTFTFSTMMIVLTMYSSQFSPRILPNFLTDRKSTTVLGVFMGSFIYSITSLLFTRQDIGEEGLISATIGVVLIIVCLAFFTYFIYHITSSIQVENLIERLYKEAIDIIEEYRKTFQNNNYTFDYSRLNEQKNLHPMGFDVTENGYLQLIDYQGVLKIAKKLDALININVKIGQFVVKGEKLFTIHAKEKTVTYKDLKELYKKFTIGSYRTSGQDIEFSIEKLVDIALRAISPGITDPNTSKECIRAIGLVLGELGRDTGEIASIKDSEGITRIVMEGVEFREILYFTFFQLRHYGKTDISIILSNLNALTIAAHHSSIVNKKNIWNFHEYIIDSIDPNDYKEMDRISIEKKINRLKRICNQVN